MISVLVISATVALPVENLPQNLEVVGSSPTRDRIFHTFVPTSAYAVGKELSHLGKRATPMPHSLTFSTLFSSLFAGVNISGTESPRKTLTL